MSILKRIIRKSTNYLLLSPIFKKTNWYRNLFIEDIYPGNNWYREHEERNYDLIVLGSSGAKWAFDFSTFSIKAMNWAQQPQTLIADYNLLRNYHSILRKGAIVVITIMPFTSLNKQTDIRDALKYQKLVAQAPIQPYLHEKARKIADRPLLMGKPAIKALLKYCLGMDEPLRSYQNAMSTENPLTSEQLDKNALSFINAWKAQFGITDFDAPLTESNIQGRSVRIQVMREMIDFIVEREYIPIYVIPPVTHHLSSYYTKHFKETYIYSFLKDVNREVRLLDYSNDSELMKDELYFNSFFMNKTGRKMFTNKVLKDLGLMK